MPFVAPPRRLVGRRARTFCRLLLLLAILLVSNTKFLWKFVGSPTQSLAANSIRLCLGDVTPDNDSAEQDAALHIAAPPVPAPMAAPHPADAEPKCSLAPRFLLSTPALWHRPPPLL